MRAYHSIRFINLFVTATIVGNEVGGWAAVHPALMTLPAQPYLAAEQALARRYLRVMPVWVSAALASYAAVLRAQRRQRSPAFGLTLASLLCLLLMLGVTARGNLPIDLRILQANPSTPPPEWASLRERWQDWQHIRVAWNLLALGLLIAGVLVEAHAQHTALPSHLHHSDLSTS